MTRFRAGALTRRVPVLVAVGGLALGLGAAAVPTAGAAEGEQARATLRLADGKSAGRVVFYGDDATVTRVEVVVALPRFTTTVPRAEVAGFHGFHVHANSDPANGEGCLADPAQLRSTWFVSADGHLAEAGTTHGDHTGDLPPLLLTQRGRAHSVTLTERFALEDVVGKAVVLHAGRDNLGNVPVGDGPTQYTPNSAEATSLTARTGNAGDRLACGVVTAR